MLDINLFYRLAAAIGIGLIIGLQREHTYSDQSDRHPAGVRSFTLVGLAGAVTSMLSGLMGGPAPFVTGFVVIGLLLVASHISFAIAHRPQDGQPAVGSDGITTSLAVLVVYLLGALSWYGRLLEACVGMVVLLLLLNAKKPLHDFANKISTEDIIATVKFAVISLMVLPFLPDRAFGPPGIEVLNPHTIWLFVVFISGIGFVSYVLIKIIGPGKGIWLTGLFGGLASSTALTLNMAARSKENESYANDFTMSIVLSWAVMFARLYLICIFLEPKLASVLAVPLLVPVIPTLGYALILKIRAGRDHTEKSSNFSNPFRLLPAIKFGLVFTAVMFIATAVRV